jgi:predicted patatin/cPLA2 family phospholipase
MKFNRGLVLEGGGMRGNYTAGVLDAFMEEGAEFPYVIGVSAGAGMGCSYVAGQHGRNFEILQKYRKDPRYLSLRSFFRTGNLFGLDFIYDEIPNRLIPFDVEAFTRSPARFITVCTDCEKGEAVYYEKDKTILTALKASSALPYISKIVEYRGRKLLDGAIVDAIPLKKAQETGYVYNVVVLTQPEGFRKKEEPHPPPSIFYRRYPLLIKALKQRVSVYNTTVSYVEAEGKNGKTLIIRPSSDLRVGRTEKNMEKLMQLYKLGRNDGKEALKTLKSTEWLLPLTTPDYSAILSG